MAAGEQVAGLDRIVHYRELHVESVSLEEHAAFIRLKAVVGHNNGRPTGPDVDRELNDKLAILHCLVVIADAADRWDGRAVHERHRFFAREQFIRYVGGSLFGVECVFYLLRIDGNLRGPPGGRNLVPPAVHAKADHGEKDDRQEDLATCSHIFLSSR